MHHYKSWSGLDRQLLDRLCDPLKGRITYFFTSYHDVHNAYGRAAIHLDGQELVGFTWMDRYRQEANEAKLYRQTGVSDPFSPALQEKWQTEATLSDHDFLSAATQYLQLSIDDALIHPSYLIRVLAILDGRVGKRRLQTICDAGEYLQLPAWVKQFYTLRLENSGLSAPQTPEKSPSERNPSCL